MVFFRRYNGKKIVTGGQVYDNQLREAISKLSDEKPLLKESVGKKPKNLFDKLCQPITIAKNGLRLSKRDKSVFLNSSACTYNLPLMFLLRIKGKKVIVIHHHYRYQLENGMWRHIYRFVEWIVLRLASYVITPNPYTLDLMKRSDEKIHTLFFPLHFDKTIHSGMIPVAGKLLYIGTIERRKGLEYLIEALLKLKSRGVKVHLDVVGKETEEDYAQHIKDIIKSECLDVTLHGFVTAEQKDALMRTTDIFTFPSMHEGFGMVLAEAQTYSLPIICFNNSAMPYTVRDGFNGFLCENRNAGAMADAIERVVSDRKLRARLSENARKSVDALASEEDFLKAVEENLYKIS